MRTCTACGQAKQLEAFRFRDKAAGRRRHVCSSCFAAYRREHYVANRAAYIKRNNQNSRLRRRALKSRVWAYLAEHPCVDCGESDPLILELDHIDPAEKVDTIYRLVHDAYSWATIRAELEKCAARCANCHRRRTAAQFGWARQRFSTGSTQPSPDESPIKASGHRGGAQRRPRASGTREVRGVPDTGANMLVCRACGVSRSVEEFPLARSGSGSRRTTCGPCASSHRREHYRRNRATYVRRNVQLFRVRRKEWARRIWTYLLTHPCVDCGQPDPVALDFDHVDPATKSYTLNQLVERGYRWTTLLAEMAKCEVRCANCHRRRTATQFDWPRLRENPIVLTL
jgi:hypothetical protein